ncbi:MAG: 16S rRNA (uracil(1498)-N(3))-methyltransferase [Flavobacteriia bacterium]
MHSFYDAYITADIKEYFLSEDESKHACRVMRLKEGDEILLLNGKGTSLTAVISEANQKKCRVRITNVKTDTKPAYSVHVAIAPTKNNDRTEWFLEKATEIGITEITLLLCSNNERKQTKEERFEKILISAMKQSKRTFLPILHALTPFKTFIQNHQKGLIAYCGEGEKQTVLHAFNALDCPILIGPEGDFTKAEVDFALKNGYKAITLGENRLRTETAGLAACMQAVICLNTRN